MRKCPVCGYEDPHYWRPNRWRHETDFTSFSDFKNFHPQLAEKLDRHEITTDQNYAYRRPPKAKHIVERITLTLYLSIGKQAFHSKMEHANHRHNNQNIQPLTNFTTKTRH